MKKELLQKNSLRHPGKFILGITGGFGSGKSTVAQFFGEFGAKVVDADALAHEAFQERCPIYPKIQKLFGRSKNLDRKKIAAVVFKDPAKRKTLEAIVHPYVFDRIDQEIKAAVQKVIAVEVPLLFETQFESFCDAVLVVSAEAGAAAKRLIKKGFREPDIEERWSAQMPLSKKEGLADLIIFNNGDFKQTRTEAEKIWKKIQEILKGE